MIGCQESERVRTLAFLMAGENETPPLSRFGVNGAQEKGGAKSWDAVYLPKYFQRLAS